MPIIVIRSKPHPAGKPRKLTPEQERLITRRYKIAGERKKELCAEFQISSATFYAIVKRNPMMPTLKLDPQASADKVA